MRNLPLYIEPDAEILRAKQELDTRLFLENGGILRPNMKVQGTSLVLKERDKIGVIQ